MRTFLVSGLIDNRWLKFFTQDVSEVQYNITQSRIVIVQESATFSSRGPHLDPATFQRATTNPADQKKDLRLKIMHITADLMAMTKGNNISAGLFVNFNHKKRSPAGGAWKYASRMKLLGDCLASTRAGWNCQAISSGPYVGGRDFIRLAYSPSNRQAISSGSRTFMLLLPAIFFCDWNSRTTQPKCCFLLSSPLNRL